MNKNILVTGASEGIGKALAIKYASCGDNLVLISRSLDKLNSLKVELKNKHKVKIIIIPTDVRNYEEVINSIVKVKLEFEKIDIAILNAGVSIENWFENLSIENFESLYKTNVFGVVYYLKELSEWMLETGGGTIAGISSCADVRGFPGASAYSSSKAALSIILESARTEFSNSNLNIITIRPGFIKTPLTDKNKYWMPFLMDSSTAANRIYNAISKNNSVYTFPKRMLWLSTIIKFLPEFIFKLSIKWRK